MASKVKRLNSNKVILMNKYIGSKKIKATPMNRAEYNEFRGWDLPTDEDGTDEGYLVEYLDGGKPNVNGFKGYISWSPKEQFDNAYQDVKVGISFGHAVTAAKEGYKIARKGWNGKGMWVIYNPGSNGETHAMFDGSVYKKHGVDECEILPHFDMYTVNSEGRRAMLPGWLASQSDIDSDDWIVVD